MQRPNGEGEWIRIRHNILGKVDALDDCLASIKSLPFLGAHGQSVVLDAAELPVILRIIANIRSPQTPRLFERLAEMVVDRRPDGKVLIQSGEIDGLPSHWTALRSAVSNFHKAFVRQCRRNGYPNARMGGLVTTLVVGAMGLTVAEQKRWKGLEPDAPLLDHCTEEELALRLVGYKLATEVMAARRARSIREIKAAVGDAAQVIGKFRTEVEGATLRRLVSRRRLTHRHVQLGFL